MSVFGRVTGWLTGKGANNAQAAYGGYRPRGYYGSPEAEDAYGSMAPGRSAAAPEEAYQQEYNPPDERFSDGSADPYNGRVPYRSRQDMYQEGPRRSAQPEQQYRQPAPQQGYPQQPEQTPYSQPGNVVDFPGQQETAPAHVEYVILLRSRNECTKVIEYIKTNASVFLNMEYIANESERQRCVDMLSGAAYTLGCQLHKISNRGIYLIASPYVRVMIDPAMKRFNASSESQPFLRQTTGEYPPVSEPEWTPQHAQAPSFTQQANEAPPQAASPYTQQQPQQQAASPYTQQQPQQQAYSPFQRPRPTLRSQQQPEPFRRAAGGQYFDRQPSADPSPFQ